MSDLVDLGTALSDNSADHIVGDINLLCQWLTGHNSTDRGSGRGTACLSRLRGSIGSGLVGASASVACVRSSTIVQSCRLRDGGGDGLAVKVRDAIGSRRSPVGMRMMSLEGIGMAILTPGRLRDVGNHLHAARNSPGRATTACSVSRSCGPSKALRELLYQRNGDIVSGNMDRIRDTKDYKRPFSGQGKAGI